MGWIKAVDAAKGDRGNVFLNGKQATRVFRVWAFGPFGIIEQATLHNGSLFLHGDEIATHWSLGLVRFEPLA